MPDGYFQIDQPRGGVENMAIDQAMLETTASDGIPRLRFYRWVEPTVSLGYFQRFADFEQCFPHKPPSVVRRATGGGAIVHHHDWTYSLAIPARLLEPRKDLGASESLYQSTHRAVVDWLHELGTPAETWTTDHSLPSACQGCDFLCFRRRHPGDVVVGDWKVMGSAQRRLAGAILQHGSLLLASSPFAPHLNGLVELAVSENQLNLVEFCTQIRQSLSSHFQIDFSGWQLPTPFVEVEPRLRERLESTEWIARI